MATNKNLTCLGAFGYGPSMSIPYMAKGQGELFVIVRGCAWNICKFLALSAPLCDVEGSGLECQPIVADTHHFGCQGVSPDMEVVDSFM